jgi:hypothetical protein
MAPLRKRRPAGARVDIAVIANDKLKKAAQEKARG